MKQISGRRISGRLVRWIIVTTFGLLLFSIVFVAFRMSMVNYLDAFCVTKPEATAAWGTGGPSYDVFGRTATCRFHTTDGSFDVTYHESGPLQIMVTMMGVAGLVTALAGYTIFRIPMGSPTGSPIDRAHQPDDSIGESVATDTDSQ